MEENLLICIIIEMMIILDRTFILFLNKKELYLCA